MTTRTTINSHRISRFGKPAALLLATAAILGLALCFMLQAPVQAQTATALLSNLGQTSAEQAQLADGAQPFRTGANTDGYVLTSIEINTDIQAGAMANTLPTLKVYSGSAGGTEVAALTTPSSASSTLTYTAPANTTLTASTTYWVVVTASPGGNWNQANSTTLDSGAATGWTIPGKAQQKSGSTYADFTGTVYFKIRVNGYATDTPGTVTLSPTETEMGIPITATLADTDGTITATTWQWSSADTASGTFTDISGAASATYRPAEADLEKFLQATASYTDALGSGKSASETTANAVHVVDRAFVDTTTQSGNASAGSGSGMTTAFTTGGHPGGYKLSSIRIRLRGTYETSTFGLHIYSATSNGRPNSSLYRLINPGSIIGDTTFQSPAGERLSPNTTYHVAIRPQGASSCTPVHSAGYGPGRASDWSVGARYFLDGSGQATVGSDEKGCALWIRGQAAIDTSYVEDVEITSSPADTNGYVVGETLEATVTMSEAVTVDTATPPTLSVVIGSTTRTMTYNATDSTSTALQFDYTLVADEEDTDGVSFDADALTGTITRTSDSKSAELEHAAVPDDADAKVVDLTAVTVEFEQSTYTVAESDDATTTDVTENEVEVTVTLSADPGRTVIIPITKTNEGGASNSDYSGVPASVTFASGETEQTFTFTATADTVDDDLEKVKLSFGTLPTGVTAGSTSETTVSITDDDYPNITVSFGAATYSVAEGFSVTIDVTLSANPERDILIPLTRTFLGNSSADDLDSESPTTVQFNDDADRTTISFRTEDDTVADHGESVRLGFGDLPAGITASGTTTTTVTIIDDDPAVAVTIRTSTAEVEEGGRARFLVEFPEPPVRPLSIPLVFTYQGGADADDLTNIPTSVEFDANDDGSEVFFLFTVDDAIADHGESIQVSFGTDLPPGVSVSSFDTTATVTIIDNDPAVTVSFGAATYSADEGDSVDVTVTLSADPQRPLTIPITGTGESGGTSADFSVPTSVTFASGDTSKTISFSATDDTIDDDDEKIKLAFGMFPPGVSAGSTSTTKVSINDDDDPELTVMFGNAAYTATEGGTTTVSVTLNADPERTVVVPISVTRESGASTSDYSGIPSTVTFNSGDTSESFTFTAVDDDIDDDGEKVKLSFGTLPARVTEGGVDESTVSITDNDTRGVTITPTALSIIELAWDDYTVVLDSEPTGEVTITITDPTDSDEVEVPTASLTFTTGNWDTEQTVRVNVGGDYVDEPDETATVTHSASGGDYGSVTVDSVVVTIEDDDATPVITGSATKNFAEFEYDADAAAFDKTVATYSATDGDTNPETTTWDVSGTDASAFTITMASGVLSFNDPPDFENPTDSGSGNTYEVTVEASDGTNTGTFDVTVTVTNVNERPDFAPNMFNNSTLREIAYDEVATDENRIVMDAVATDPESDNVTFSLGGADQDDFSLLVVQPGYVVVLLDSLDYEAPTDADEDNEYHFTLEASDGSKARQRAYTVTVTNINERPDIHEESVPDYPEIEYDFDGTRPVVHTFTATDPEGDDIQWYISHRDNVHFSITVSGGVLTFDQDPNTGPQPDYENPRDGAFDDYFGVSPAGDNVYTLQVYASDGQWASVYDFTVTVTNVNEKPEFTGTPATAISYDEKKTENVADYNARDEEGPVTWTLTGTDRGDFAISTDGIVTFAATPNYEDAKDSNTDNVYTFNVVATDTQSGSTRLNATTSVTVTVNDLEEAGVITVSNLNPGVGDEITFELSDPDGGLKDISWNLESRASSTASWSAVSGWFTSVSQATLATYSVGEDVTGHELRMRVDYADRRTTATDDPNTLLVKEGQDKAATSDDTEPVTADPIVNAPPRFRGGGDFSIAEGEAGRNVGTPLVVSDRDNDTLRFGIEAGAGDDFFAINATSGQLSLLKAVDFEDPPVAGFYLITVTLHDGKDADGNTEADPVVDTTTSVSVTVTDVEEDGVVTLSSDEPETGEDLDATLEDGDGSLSGESWQWARSSNGRTGWLNILDATSSFYTPVEADEDFFLRATVKYTDNRGSGKSAEAITKRPVPSLNRRPAFPDSEDGERTVDENSRAGANIGAPVAAVDPERNRLTYTLTGTDADAFTIVSSSGQIRVKDALDFETKDSYSVTVNVHDGRDGSGATSTTIDNTQDVTITVENVEEPGTVTLTTAVENISARVEVTAALTDLDGNVTGLTWQWSQSPNGRTGWANIGGATSESYTPTDDHEGRYIRATASYTDGHGSSKTAHGVSPRRVEEPPPVNSPPAFPSTEDGQRDVPENSAGGTTIGAPIAATDLNAGDAAVNDPLSYSLTGTDAASFTIDTGTGQLALAQNVALDFEGKRSYRVTVQVTDGRDRNGDDDNDVIDDTINVTINVTNVNEAPTVSGEATATFTENDSSAIATYTGSDPERDDLTWSTAGADGDSFAMTDRGRLHFASPPSFEGGKTEYAVTVVATDEGDLTGTFEVTVTVTDEEEEGAVTITPLRGWTDTQFSATLTDGDGGLADQTWQWAQSTNRSSWTDITGATSNAYTATADDVGNYLRVSTEYTDSRGSGKTAEAVLAVRVADAADKPTTNATPEFADATATRSVGQGTAAGRSVGAPLRARDADSDDVLTYSLSGADAEKFAIDPATGQLRTKAVLAYDPQGRNTLTVMVNVHDSFDVSYSPDSVVDDTITVTITVTAVSRRTTVTGGGGGFGPAPTAPKFTDGFRTMRPLALNARPGDAVGDPVAATHPEDSPLTYSLSGANASLFTVDAATGQIQLGLATTLELGHTYTVNLTATDSAGTGAIIIVDIEVVEELIDPYDLNRNGIIEKNEVMKAVSDYFAGLITKEEALDLVTRYFA